MFRTEKDVLGQVKVPKDAYYGSFTARASANFQISGITAPAEFKIALGLVKKAAAMTNQELKELDHNLAKAIIQAADEFIQGKFDDQFQLDVFQAGAGTPFNMNSNEILANRANEIILKNPAAKGTYSPVTPNNHVNMAQSSNDVIPTAIRLAALLKLPPLLTAVADLAKSFQKIADTSQKILKVGRTHLQDAVPIRAGQEFEAYGSAIERCHKHIQNSFEHLHELGIGATALGTGITTHPDYRHKMVENLSKLLNQILNPSTKKSSKNSAIKLKATRFPMELTHGMNAFVVASNSLRVLANDLMRIANDLKLLVSGPYAGIAEIIMPEVEPGSSIMPGKVNPSIPECVTITACQIIGNDHVISLAAQMGQLELNVMTPAIMYNLLWSMELLSNTCRMFQEFCIDGIKIDADRCAESLQKSFCLATGLSPYLGYKVTAELVKETIQKKQPLAKVVSAKKFMTEQELQKILSADQLTAPQKTDQQLVQKIKKNEVYQSYLKKL